jgi:hypothetical protein
MHGRAAGRWLLVSTLIGLASLGAVDAQTSTPNSPRAPAVAALLPVRRVVLYKSGVGYFEHVGRVRGTQNVSIDFTSGQLDDVLSTLTTLDLDGGRVLGVSYNSDDALDRRLGALHLPVGAVTTQAALLGSLRGARIEIGGSGHHLVGRVLGVEQSIRSTATGSTTVEMVSVVTDDSELHSVALEPGVTVRLLDADLRQEVGQYLSLVASARDQDQRRLTIAASGTGDRDLFVSYVSEVPVWKATYRLVLPEAGASRKPLLQGWAIIDNTGAQDWSNVQLSLVAGAPQSFIQPLSRPLYVQRPVVPLPTRVSLSPQTHQAALSTGGLGVLSGTVADGTGAVMPGVTVAVTRSGTPVGQVVSDQRGHFQVPNLPPGPYDVTATLAGFRQERRVGLEVAGGMETILTFRMMIGSPGEAVTVVSESPLVDTKKTSTGRVAGSASGQQRDAWQNVQMQPGVVLNGVNVGQMSYDALAAQQAVATGQAVGDLFAYQVRDPVTIRRSESALVPILAGEIEAERISLWNPAGTGLHPLRGVWVTNSTGLTLDAGSFSVIDGQAFAGEGLVDAMKPGDRRLLSYASDLGVQVVPRQDSVPGTVTRIRIAHGTVTQESEERQRQTYVVRNDDTDPRTVVLEHPVHAGWTIAGTVTPDETTAQWLRFRVAVASKTTVNFAVEESRPLQSEFAVSTLTDDQIAFMIRGQLISPVVQAQLEQIQAQKAEIARLAGAVANRQSDINAIGVDQQRVRDNMQALKGSAEERQLVQRYVKQLNDEETQLAGLRQDLDALSKAHDAAEATLGTLIEAINVGGLAAGLGSEPGSPSAAGQRQGGGQVAKAATAGGGHRLVPQLEAGERW